MYVACGASSKIKIILLANKLCTLITSTCSKRRVFNNQTIISSFWERACGHVAISQPIRNTLTDFAYLEVFYDALSGSGIKIKKF